MVVNTAFGVKMMPDGRQFVDRESFHPGAASANEKAANGAINDDSYVAK